MTAIDKALTGEWYEIKEARKALDSVAERLTSMQQEREEEHQKARRYREALERIRALDWNKEGIEGAHSLRDETLAENQRLQAEVARLKEALEKRGEHMQNWVRCYFRVCKERDEAMAKQNDLIVKVQFAESVIRDEKQIECTATEAALRWAQSQHPDGFPYYEGDFIDRGLKALLGEGEK